MREGFPSQPDCNTRPDWKEEFIRTNRLVVRVILHVLPGLKKMLKEGLPEPLKEEQITFNLMVALRENGHIREELHHIEYQHEPYGQQQEIAYSKGKIDIAVFWDQEVDQYLAYECKRLNVPRDGNVRSLATEYVQDGIMRFVTGQYSANLPAAGMLGYVLDGDLCGAYEKIRQAIHAQFNNGQQAATCGPCRRMDSAKHFTSDHSRDSGEPITILHTLLDFS